MSDTNNSGGGNAIVPILLVSVLIIGGYLVYKAGKSAAAAAAAKLPGGATGIHPGTTLAAGHGATTIGAAATGTGLLNSIFGLFKSKPKTTSPGVGTSTPYGGYNAGSGGSSGGGSGTAGNVNYNLPYTVDNNNWDGLGGYWYVYDNGLVEYYNGDGVYAGSGDGTPEGFTPASNVQNTSSDNNATVLDDNNWDDAGGYREVYNDGSCIYYDVDGNVKGYGDTNGNWTAA